MELSLSVRVAEKFRAKREASMSLTELADLAVEHGYAALCMRASQIGVHSAAEEVAAARRRLDEKGLRVSMVTGDFAIPENSAAGPDALQRITPYLDLAEVLGAPLLRVCMKTGEDIAPAQQAADEAAERGLRLAHQCHHASLFERVDDSIDVLRRIGRPNFGLIYEPANLELCGQAYGMDTLRRLAPFLFNVYLQNQRLIPEGADVLETWCRGPVRFDQIPLWEKGGIDFSAILAALGGVGYEGCITVHQASAELGAREAVARSAGYLRSLLEMG